MQVINVATARKNWSLLGGFMTKKLTYTVTYQEVEQEQGNPDVVDK